MFGYNNTDVDKALEMTGSQYRLPASAAAESVAVQQQAAPEAPPTRTPTPSYVGQAQDMAKAASAVAGSTGSPEDEGKKNQQEALNKIGSVLGAVANFYTGNWVGAAQSAQGLLGGDKEGKKSSGGGGLGGAAGGMLGGLFGGG